MWHPTHDRSRKVSGYSQICSHSTSAENTCLGRSDERCYVMQVKEIKGRKTDFGLELRICSGLAPPAHLEGVCTCRSYELTGLSSAWRLLNNHSWGCLAEHQLCCPRVRLILHPPSAVHRQCCWSGCACPVLQSLPFLMAQSSASLVKLHVGSMHENGGVRVVSLTAWGGAVANCVCLGTCFVVEGCGRLMEWRW